MRHIQVSFRYSSARKQELSQTEVLLLLVISRTKYSPRAPLLYYQPSVNSFNTSNFSCASASFVICVSMASSISGCSPIPTGFSRYISIFACASLISRSTSPEVLQYPCFHFLLPFVLLVTMFFYLKIVDSF